MWLTYSVGRTVEDTYLRVRWERPAVHWHRPTCESKDLWDNPIVLQSSSIGLQHIVMMTNLSAQWIVLIFVCFSGYDIRCISSKRRVTTWTYDMSAPSLTLPWHDLASNKKCAVKAEPAVFHKENREPHSGTFVNTAVATEHLKSLEESNNRYKVYGQTSEALSGPEA